ncbi:hypothetical protein [Streptomyces californicus]
MRKAGRHRERGALRYAVIPVDGNGIAAMTVTRTLDGDAEFNAAGWTAIREAS